MSDQLCLSKLIRLSICSFFASFLIFQTTLSAQNVGIGTDTPNTSALLDLTSSDKGLLIPRVDTGSVVTPAVGLLIFQPADSVFYYHNGNQWIRLSLGPILADKDQDTRIEVEENPDDDRIRFKLNNSDKIQLMHNPGGHFQISVANNSGNLFLGNGAGDATAPLGINNIFMGSGAGLENIIGDDNIAIGVESLSNHEQGDKNISIGYRALSDGADKNENVALGYQALQNSEGDFNVAIGNSALEENTTGENNIAIGKQALEASTNKNFNIGIGYRALASNSIGAMNANEGVSNVAI